MGDRWQIPLCPFATRTAVAQPDVSPALTSSTFRHHLDCPSKIVLGDHRAFWVACRSRCVDQHASLVHSLLPGRAEPSLEKHCPILTLLENLRLCSNRWSSSFRPMRISSSQERTPGSVTFQSDLWKAVAFVGPREKGLGKLWKVGCAKLRKLS